MTTMDGKETFKDMRRRLFWDLDASIKILYQNQSSGNETYFQGVCRRIIDEIREDLALRTKYPFLLGIIGIYS